MRKENSKKDFQDRESNSEWETEDEEVLVEAEEEALNLHHISVVSESGPQIEPKPESKQRGVIIFPTDDTRKETKYETIKVKQEAGAKTMEVRKKDLFEFSTQNSKANPSQAQKKGCLSQGGPVLGGKIKKDQAAPKLVRNPLHYAASSVGDCQ